MPEIKLTDQFGLDVDAQPGPGLSLSKYFQQLKSMRLDSLDLSKLGGLTLDQPAIQSLSTGLSFSDPVPLGDGGPSLTISAGIHGSLKIIDDLDDLPGAGDDPDEPAAGCYVALAIEATASAAISGAAGGITFGASPSTTVTFANYSRFTDPPRTSLLDAVRQTAGAIVLPAKSEDLAGLAPGQIASVEVSGKLKFSGSADLFVTANPLAAAALPAPLPAVSVSAGGSATVGVSVSVDTDYRLLARRLDSGGVRLGWYNRRSDTASVTATVSEGVSVEVGSGDVFSQIIGVISGDAKADLKELQSGGLSKEQAKSVQEAAKAAVSRKLEIAVAAEFTASRSGSAAFLFDIDLEKLTDASRSAVDSALHGDLGSLHQESLPGVTAVRSIWQTVRKRSLELNVNLLGVVNFGSIAKLAISGEVLFEPATGALVITDEATAERIRTTALNFGADTEKLRRVLAESFLITAAYHGTRVLAGDAALSCSHTFFTLRNNMAAHDLATDLRTGAALGLLAPDEAELPAGIADFGRTLVAISTDYDPDLAARMFLDSAGAPLPAELYETAGRAAIQIIVQPGDDDAIRRLPAIDDTLWGRMKENGQPGIPAMFEGVAAPLAEAIVADYSTIRWWADAMSGTAQHLSDFRLWHSRHLDASPDDPEFQKRRHDLADHLRKVAATTREEFGAPWGLLAMNHLIGLRSGAKMLVTGPRLVLNKSRAIAGATGS